MVVLLTILRYSILFYRSLCPLPHSRLIDSRPPPNPVIVLVPSFCRWAIITPAGSISSTLAAYRRID
jgi:hypothetical protein